MQIKAFCSLYVTEKWSSYFRFFRWGLWGTRVDDTGRATDAAGRPKKGNESIFDGGEMTLTDSVVEAGYDFAPPNPSTPLQSLRGLWRQRRRGKPPEVSECQTPPLFTFHIKSISR